MRITELFTAQSIALDEAAADQAQIIDRLVELQQPTATSPTEKPTKKPSTLAKPKRPPTWITASRCPTPALPV